MKEISYGRFTKRYLKQDAEDVDMERGGVGRGTMLWVREQLDKGAKKVMAS